MGDDRKLNIERMDLLLRTVCFNIKQKGREILQDFKITPPQFDALQFIIDEGEMTVSELSEKLYLAPSTITDLIDRMEANGLVKRARAPRDRRTVRISAEDKGHRLLDEVITRRCKYLEELVKDMPVEDRIRFTVYLEQINR